MARERNNRSHGALDDTLSRNAPNVPRNLIARQRGRETFPEGAPRDPLFNDSVQKALAVLEAFGRGRRVLKLAEVADAAGISKPSAQRCIHTLEALGYVRREERDTGWRLTPRSLTIAHAYLSGYRLLEQAQRHLIDLNQETGESVSLSEPEDCDMVFVARFPSHKPFLIHMPVGRRLPMYCTASGRAYLSALPPAEAQQLLRRSELRPMTPMTVTDPRRIMKLIDIARADGYAYSDQECYRGDVTVAAAVIGEDGRPVGAINVSGPTSRWTLERMRTDVAEVVIRTARAISSGTAASGGA